MSDAPLLAIQDTQTALTMPGTASERCTPYETFLERLTSDPGVGPPSVQPYSESRGGVKSDETRVMTPQFPPWKFGIPEDPLLNTARLPRPFSAGNPCAYAMHVCVHANAVTLASANHLWVVSHAVNSLGGTPSDSRRDWSKGFTISAAKPQPARLHEIRRKRTNVSIYADISPGMCESPN